MPRSGLFGFGRAEQYQHLAILSCGPPSRHLQESFGGPPFLPASTTRMNDQYLFGCPTTLIPIGNPPVSPTIRQFNLNTAPFGGRQCLPQTPHVVGAGVPVRLSREERPYLDEIGQIPLKTLLEVRQRGAAPGQNPCGWRKEFRQRIIPRPGRLREQAGEACSVKRYRPQRGVGRDTPELVEKLPRGAAADKDDLVVAFGDLPQCRDETEAVAEAPRKQHDGRTHSRIDFRKSAG